MICALVALTAAFGSTAKAENPVSWDFSLETSGEDVDWYSTTNIDPGYPQYNYVWELTAADLMVSGTRPVDIYPDMPPGDRGGTGTVGGIPFVDELILHIDYQEITADFYVTVNTGGFGEVSVRNITLGTHPPYGAVTSAWFEGNITVTAVPEPATLLMLALGGLPLLRNRSRMRRFPTSGKTGRFSLGNRKSHAEAKPQSTTELFTKAVQKQLASVLEEYLIELKN